PDPVPDLVLEEEGRQGAGSGTGRGTEQERPLLRLASGSRARRFCRMNKDRESFPFFPGSLRPGMVHLPPIPFMIVAGEALPCSGRCVLFCRAPWLSPWWRRSAVVPDRSSLRSAAR